MAATTGPWVHLCRVDERALALHPVQAFPQPIARPAQEGAKSGSSEATRASRGSGEEFQVERKVAT